ncbi:MFS transporter [Actinocorallia sp. API 0066]|uniref:MFS transporter n=1 Tax=Actinocorallia sp. API 0066 TaxID=2896846 RepID=UPI001E6358CA|nr:MFS transporter [Actinocorallia sp. API 0066]MCD0450490.1 MFS transporter [Actinocorallia sp. API 0066]
MSVPDTATEPAARALTPARRWWILAAVSLATFMSYMDNNILNVALPSIQRELNVTIAGLEWIVSSYVLVFCGLMLAGGRLADLYGRRRFFLLGVGVFTAASLMAGLAGDLTTLVAGRVLQGIGAALAIPVSLAVLTDTFRDERELNRAVGVWSAVGALALALGPPIGGFISEHFRWGWVFLINVPFGLLTMVIAWLTLRESRAATATRIDVPGLAASILVLFPLTYALIEAHVRGWGSPVILGSFTLAALALAAFVVIENRATDPMVDLALFRNRVFSGGLVAMVLWGFGVMGVYFFTALYFQNILGFTPTRAGAAFIPLALCMAVAAILAETATRRLGAAVTVVTGLALTVAGMVAGSLPGQGSGFTDFLPAFVLLGVGSGLALIPLTAVVLGALPPERAGAVSGLVNASRELSALLGVTVVGAMLTARQAAVERGGTPPPDSFVDGYQFALQAAAAIVALGLPLSAWVLRRRKL